MIAASDESTCCSPYAMSGNGSEISTTAKIAIQRHAPATDPSVPARHASPSSTTAASTMRDQARKIGGTPSSTASLMNRYGIPHSVAIAANAAHARELMAACLPRPAIWPPGPYRQSLDAVQAQSPSSSTARKASCGTSIRPTDFMRFFPSFCFSSSLRLRLMSPP